MSENRRTQTRYDVDFPASVTVDDFTYEVTLQNLSLGGAFVTYHDRPPMGQRVQIAFTIPIEDHRIEVGGAVRWGTGEGIGIQFDGLRARDVWALNKYFEQLREP